jgi:hypothetical protein
MGFDVKDYLDLVRLLQEHPEWRAELRRLLLTDELLALPELVRELADVQRRTEERLLILTERIDALAEAQRRTEERVGGLEDRVGRLEAGGPGSWGSFHLRSLRWLVCGMKLTS